MKVAGIGLGDAGTVSTGRRARGGHDACGIDVGPATERLSGYSGIGW
jgi:hypothetical protein